LHSRYPAISNDQAEPPAKRRSLRGRNHDRHSTGVKTLVLSHLTPAIDSITDDTWRAPAAKYFKGEIIVGKDLMVL
jgi:hypothetical protein